MALEAVVFPQDPFIYYPNPTRDLYNYPFVPIHELGLQSEEDRVGGILGNYCYGNQSHNYWDPTSSSPEQQQQQPPQQLVPPPQQAESAEPATSGGGRRKRRRVKSSKNREEIENQRMTHIAVERNRRKQMNEYLAVLRSLMPPSYSQRGDQASIIGGAINFVKELEQLLQSMEAQKSSSADATIKPNPFSDFFSFPQYSTRPAGTSAHSVDSSAAGVTEPTASSATSEHHQWPPAAADIEVTMVESHANLKILSKKRPKQLLKLVAGLQANRLSILHLNVTSVDALVLYSLSVKIEDGCQMNTVDEIAAAINQIFRRIEDEAAFS